MPKTHKTISVSILAHNPTTNRIEQIVHLGRVSAPATSTEILKLVRRAIRARSPRAF